MSYQTVKWEDVPEKTRFSMRHNLKKSAYPEQWVGWIGMFDDELDAQLKKTYNDLCKHSGESWGYSKIQDMFDDPIDQFTGILLSGFTDTFKEKYIEGSSWEQGICETISNELEKMCDLIGITLAWHADD